MFLTILTICSFGQTRNSNDIEGLIVNPEIKKEAENNIMDLEDFKDINLGMQIYETKVAIEFYENDSLILSTMDNPKGIISKSFYYWTGDTLTIDGGIGLAVGAGFSLKLVTNKATVYHMISSDEFPMYAYGETTDIIHRLNVPCLTFKVVLSELPEKKDRNQIIYGYVEFESDKYFARQSIEDGKEIGPRKKSRANMKMYFRSGLLER